MLHYRTVDSESSDGTPLTGNPRKSQRKETENVTKHSRTAVQHSGSVSEDEDHAVSFRTRSRCIKKKPKHQGHRRVENRKLKM